MKRLSFILVVVLVFTLIIGGCSEPEETTTTSESPSSTTTTTTSPAAGTPQSGGILKIIGNAGLTSAGYPPLDFGLLRQQDVTRRLINWDIEGNIVPELAKSWEMDMDNNTLTWYLEEGVKFTDGTDFDAEAAIWNIQRLIDVHFLTEADKVVSLEAVDTYTVKMNLTQLNSQAVGNYGWVAMYSPTAIETNGEEWAKTHQVGVGPFILESWSPENYANYKKFDDFYIEGTPYLDGINFRIIPDPVSASAMMEAGEADLWFDAPVKYAVDLEKKGFKVNWSGTGLFWGLWPNSSDPNSIWSDKTLREALEYAIDREGLANALGYGKVEALTQIAPKGSTGYNEGYNPRPYDPEKARQLIEDAGYPGGFETTILCTSGSQDYATYVQGNLMAVGIDAKIDLADTARYNAMFMSGIFMGEPWPDLAIGMIGIDLPFATGLLRHLGPTPMTGILGISKSPEFLALCDELYQAFDNDELTRITKEAVKQAAEDAMMVPLVRIPWATIMKQTVYDDNSVIHNVVWNNHLSWMEQE